MRFNVNEDNTVVSKIIIVIVLIINITIIIDSNLFYFKLTITFKAIYKVNSIQAQNIPSVIFKNKTFSALLL